MKVNLNKKVMESVANSQKYTKVPNDILSNLHELVTMLRQGYDLDEIEYDRGIDVESLSIVLGDLRGVNYNYSSSNESVKRLANESASSPRYKALRAVESRGVDGKKLPQDATQYLRLLLAQQGFFLEELSRDPNQEVRDQVANSYPELFDKYVVEVTSFDQDSSIAKSIIEDVLKAVMKQNLTVYRVNQEGIDQYDSEGEYVGEYDTHWLTTEIVLDPKNETQYFKSVISQVSNAVRRSKSTYEYERGTIAVNIVASRSREAQYAPGGGGLIDPAVNIVIYTDGSHELF